VLGWASGGPLTRRAQAFARHCVALFAPQTARAMAMLPASRSPAS
jgi:hypothetical protein